MDQTPMLDRIQSPADLRALAPESLKRLAAEVRRELVRVIGQNGGHLSSNLGVVELTLALHRIYDFSRDRLVFDVGHQCYTHKLLTGRRERFDSIRCKDGLTGFPNPAESAYDPFVVGHASTSISSAVGLAAGIRLQGGDEQVVAVVGDGSVGGGMCFEAMNHAGHSQENVLVILNDNEMAISKTVGAFTRHLTDLRSRPETQRLRKDLHQVFQNIPLIGDSLEWFQERLLDALKNHTGAAAVFSAMGFHFFGPVDGHDIEGLEHELQNLRQLPGPRLLHVATQKGQGFDAATADPETYHSSVPFEVRGCGEVIRKTKNDKTYTSIFVDSLLRCAAEDKKVVAITAAMPSGTGINRFAEAYPQRFFDVGICEAHSVTFAAGLARSGCKPVVAIYSTFLQRGYDQIVHDIALQQDLSVVFAIDRAGLVGSDGPTHHGVFDIAFLRHIPGLVLMAPRDGAELDQMLSFALASGRVVAIRYPRGGPPVNTLPETWAPLEMGRSEHLREGRDGTVLAYGRMVEPSLRAAKMAAEQGMDLAVVNARFAAPLDDEMLRTAVRDGGAIFTVEDHVLAGGFGSAVCERLADLGLEAAVQRIGIPDAFVEHGGAGELDALLGLDAAGLLQRFVSAKRISSPVASPEGA